MQNPNVVYKLDGVTDVMESELKSLVEKNLFGENCKMSSSLKKIYSKGGDVKVVVRVTVKKVADGYDGNFKFEYDGKSLDYDRQSFEILADLVNHAFDNFKQRILAK
ncbi:MAG TPA: hypothetical protein VJ892_01690 [Candidatus Absconditabacterales bacterium]|nr:hypothetical protein [Candidatus Absconditabacterales bacterium]